MAATADAIGLFAQQEQGNIYVKICIMQTLTGECRQKANLQYFILIQKAKEIQG